MESRPTSSEDRAAGVEAILWTETVLSMVIVSLRVWGKMTIRKFGADDVFMILTVAIFIAFSSVGTCLAAAGGFRHIETLNPEQLTYIKKLNWISRPIVVFGFAAGKTSVALLIMRFLSPSMKLHRITLHSLIIATWLVSIVATIVICVQCRPLSALWTTVPGKLSPGVCWNPKIENGYAIFSAVWGVFGDVVLAILPAEVISRLEISLKKKIGLSMLLGLGIIAGVTGAVKTSRLVNLSGSDLTWISYDLYAWSAAELFVTIFCGCAPPIKPLYDHYFGKKRNTRRGYSKYGTRSSNAKAPSSHRYNNIFDSKQRHDLYGNVDVSNSFQLREQDSLEPVLPPVGRPSNEFVITKHTRIEVESEPRFQSRAVELG